MYEIKLLNQLSVKIAMNFSSILSNLMRDSNNSSNITMKNTAVIILKFQSKSSIVTIVILSLTINLDIL